MHGHVALESDLLRDPTQVTHVVAVVMQVAHGLVHCWQSVAPGSKYPVMQGHA